ncbi:MAG: polysaccharide biosynthesis protein [Caldilineales bacterium]|nr:polysaccharide biosynthesis protein [Caldilineales bacterium]
MNAVRNRHFFVTDVLFLSLAVYVTFVLRLERFDIDIYWRGMFVFALITVVVVPIVFRQAGVYSRYWRYASIEEVVLLTATVSLAVIVTGILSLIVAEVGLVNIHIPRSIPLIFVFLAVTATACPRLAIRVFDQFSLSNNKVPSSAESVAIMGAGDAGLMIVRELQRNPQLGMRVVAFFDDDPGKHNVRIHGILVLGGRKSIPKMATAWRFRKVIIAMPTVAGREIRDIVNICEQAGLQTMTMPGMYELIGGQVSINQLRNIEIEDLLRRDPIQTDIQSVRELIADECVMVTGGGGSIGAELCRQIWRCAPRHLVLVGHGENSVFDIHNELWTSRNRQGDSVGSDGRPQITPVIADIRFPDAMRAVVRQYKPSIIFHAAAHKHVPLMERNPDEAITNNVLGTCYLLEAALAEGVERFVMISTDKAVNPTSVMGASKRVAEFLVHRAARQSGRPYVAVRFGNVLGSRGSVVNTFKQQIARGGPVTVTHPDMKRFFMTIPEAVQLVLQASVLGKGGEVFLLDMGEPVRIEDLARDLIELSGYDVGTDIEIVYSGIRPGEKLFEELFVEGEEYTRTRHEKIFIAGNASSFVPNDLSSGLLTLENAARRRDAEAIKLALHRLVPEYHPADIQSEAITYEKLQRAKGGNGTSALRG